METQVQGPFRRWVHGYHFTAAEGGFNREAVAEGYSIDSRSIQRGQLFFAVRGERLDGHDFVEAALAAGALSETRGLAE